MSSPPIVQTNLQIKKITSSIATGTLCDFNNSGAGPAGLRTYDANGNLIEDPYKGIDIDYNYLNLPKTMDFPGSDEIKVTYDASGNKLSQTTLQGGVSTTRDYLRSRKSE